MEISKKFRQDAGYYMLGVIVPGIINAITIPILKKLLGSAGFGVYGIRYNFMLLLAAFSVGWLCQSVIRFKFTRQGEDHFFYYTAFRIAAWVIGSITFISLFVSWFYFKSSLVFCLLFATSYFFCGFQNVLIAVSQANFLARFTMYSEAIRTCIFFGMAMLLLWLKWLPDINALFVSLIISYLVSIFLLYRKNNIPQKLSIRGIDPSAFKATTKKMLQYGIPLSFWHLIAYLMLFVDKPLLAEHSGYEVQGNYQALYEIISKGSVVFMLPVSYAIFPLLSNAYENNNEELGIRLLKKVIFISIGIFSAGLVAYWIFGYWFLQWMLSIPGGMDYKWCGFFMLASTMVWQVGVLLHKPFELRLQTSVMLKMAAISLVVFLLLLLALRSYSHMGIYRFTLPFMGASISYVIASIIWLGQHKNMRRHFDAVIGMMKKQGELH